jgi:hypothetical protein
MEGACCCIVPATQRRSRCELRHGALRAVACTRADTALHGWKHGGHQIASADANFLGGFPADDGAHTQPLLLASPTLALPPATMSKTAAHAAEEQKTKEQPEHAQHHDYTVRPPSPRAPTTHSLVAAPRAANALRTLRKRRRACRYAPPRAASALMAYCARARCACATLQFLTAETAKMHTMHEARVCAPAPSRWRGSARRASRRQALTRLALFSCAAFSWRTLRS